MRLPRLPAGVTRERAAGATVALLALVSLGAGALHGGHTESRLDNDHNVTRAERSNAYFDCLTAQAHSLLDAGDVVYLPRPTLGEWVTVTKVIGGWARLTLHRSAANVGLAIDHSSGARRGGCQGDVLVTATRLPDGHVTFARGFQHRR